MMGPYADSGRSLGRMSLTEQAYHDIKDQIMECRLQPGQLLNESQLVKELGYGRTPTHEALNQLDHEKLVEILPRKGVMVAPLSLNDVLETAEVRIACECLSVTLACERATQAELGGLRDIIDQMLPVVGRREVPSMMKLDLRFHRAIAASTRNQTLVDSITNLHERQVRFWFITLSESEHMKDTYDEHSTILDALMTRDVESARSAMEYHIRQFQRTAVHIL